MTPPAATFASFLRSGSLLFLSGCTANINREPWLGQLGATVTSAQGKAAAVRWPSISRVRFTPPSAI